MTCPECKTRITETDLNAAIQHSNCYFLCRHCFAVLYWAERGLHHIGDHEMEYLEEHNPHRLHEIVSAIVGYMKQIAAERPIRPRFNR